MVDLINVETSRLAVVSTESNLEKQERDNQKRFEREECQQRPTKRQKYLEVIYKKTSNPYKKKIDLIDDDDHT